MNAAPATGAPAAPDLPAVAPPRRSALHHRLLAAGARMGVVRGWEVAVALTDEADERRAARTGVVLADASARHLVLAQSAALTTWLPLVPEVGGVARLPDDAGPVCCCRLTADNALLMSPDPVELPPPPETCGHSTILTGGRTIIVVAGPRSVELLAMATQVDLRERALPDGRCVQSSVARVPATIVRTDHGAIRRYQLVVPRDYGEYLWETLLDAGVPLGARAVGTAALEAEG